jgi:hypothetical protein
MLPSLCEIRVSRSIFGLMGFSISASRRVLHLWVFGFHILATVSRNFSSLGSISPLRNCDILSLCLCRLIDVKPFFWFPMGAPVFLVSMVVSSFLVGGGVLKRLKAGTTTPRAAFWFCWFARTTQTYY